jgi:hypothetical protein
MHAGSLLLFDTLKRRLQIRIAAKIPLHPRINAQRSATLSRISLRQSACSRIDVRYVLRNQLRRSIPSLDPIHQLRDNIQRVMSLATVISWRARLAKMSRRPISGLPGPKRAQSAELSMLIGMPAFVVATEYPASTPGIVIKLPIVADHPPLPTLMKFPFHVSSCGSRSVTVTLSS